MSLAISATGLVLLSLLRSRSFLKAFLHALKTPCPSIMATRFR
jgi:hypothetical protein